MGASRMEERIMCAMGLSCMAPLVFQSCEALPHGGALLLLPFLLECGLMSYRLHYAQRSKGYYSFDNLLIIIAFLYLCRIKSFEQVKHYSPGEFGKLVGYDRIPEVKTLRILFSEITSQKCADKWASALSLQWIEDENPELYYIDGHVQVYHGYLANLGKKHISRQRLCLPGVMEFWVNASDGNPYFYVTADVNEKMIEMLDDEIIPMLIKLHSVSEERKRLMDEDTDEPLFTLVFDREAYSPAFFFRLWNEYRIAVITYRKNAKDNWDETLFTNHEVLTAFGSETMKLHEQSFHPLKSEQQSLREVRRLCQGGHQTSIVTTHRKLTVQIIASHLFARWSQELWFRFMRQEYALDKIVQYSTDELDDDIKVVNVEYNNMSYKIKKEREKLSRRKAGLYELEQKNPLQEEDEKENEKWMKKKMELMDGISQMEQQVEDLVRQRKQIPYKIPISQMPENVRYNQLNRESKMVQNIIKMICYRAETALANLLSPYYKRARQEVRALVKSVIKTPVNMEVDNTNQVINITLFSLSTQRDNYAVSQICEKVNQTNTLFPDTNYRLNFKIATLETALSQES